MAGRKGSLYRFLAHSMSIGNEANGVFPSSDEFDESDVVWGTTTTVDTELRSTDSTKSSKPIPSSRASRKRPERGDRVTAASAAASLPVSIPDWSRIIRDESRGGGGGMEGSDGGGINYSDGRMVCGGEEEEEEGEGTGVVIPPHELLRRRNRGASFSVHEGIGRTLKGRDLRRVRNAIFEKTGFVD